MAALHGLRDGPAADPRSALAPFSLRALRLAAAFFLLPAFGMLTHELAHLAAARALAHEARLHWAWVSLEAEPLAALQEAGAEARAPAAALAELAPHDRRDWLLFNAAGPLQTLLVGLAGWALLWRRRRALCARGRLDAGGWAALLAALTLTACPLGAAAWVLLGPLVLP